MDGIFYAGKKRLWATTPQVGVEEVVLRTIVHKCFMPDTAWHGWLVYGKANGHGVGLIVGAVRPRRKELKRHRLPVDVAEVPPKFQPLLLAHGPEGLRWDGNQIIAAGH